MPASGPASVASRVQKHRAALRASGLRPVQIWVPDTRRPDFAETCRAQIARVNAAESGTDSFFDDTVQSIDGWNA